MNFNMNIPGLKDVEITKVEEVGDRIALYVQLPKCTHPCPVCEKNIEGSRLPYTKDQSFKMV